MRMPLYQDRPSLEGVSALLARTPYRAKRLLGRGGMGEVWMVEHEFLGRPFALKLLHRHLGHFADRMRLEAQTMGRVNHPHVVDVVDFWIADDARPCVVMELLDGRTLWDELLDRHQLPVSEACELACEALSALGAAHALGVVHRDIKPENLFLHDAPGYRRVLKVLDFGIARVLSEVSPRTPAPPEIRTATGAFMGSPRFMSPEQCRGEPVDHRADLYSIGFVLYIMLTGHGPFDTGESHPAPPSRHAKSVPLELDGIVLHSIAERAGERFQSAAEFITALRPFVPSVVPFGAAI